MKGVYCSEMRKFALCFLLFSLPFGMYATGGIKESLDSTSGVTQRVILSESPPAEKAKINRFKFHKEHIEGDCLCADYTIVETDSLSTRSDIDDFINILLYQHGVMPDLIEATYVFDIEYLKERFEEKPVYKAEVLYKGEPLPLVSWKEFPNLKTSGVFATSDSTLSPQHRGFMFSPDIYNFTDKNTKSSGPILFRAIKYDLEERLRYDVPLRGKHSMVSADSDYITTMNLDFIEDPTRGEVAYFNGKSSYIDIRSDFEEKLQEISISAWIKPEEVEGNLSLVGKGEVFSAKIFNGKLRFTAIGIKDHTTTDQIVEKDVWSHIAMVYVPEKKLYFYLNGELIEEVPASGLQHANHALLVGSNLWGQNYSGLMSDLNIWKRGLSDEEVRETYLSTSEISSSSSLLVGWFGVLASGSLMLVGLFYFRKKKVLPVASKEVKAAALEPAEPREPYRNRINLLDGFRVWNTKGEDCTHRFSPKRMELMVLIIIYTLKDGGITSKELSDILWPGFSAQNKKNNRGTQIKEIRNILGSELGAEIVFKEKKWKFDFNDDLQVDLFDLHKLLPKFFAIDKIGTASSRQAVALSQIVSNGPLLPEIEEEWLDRVKANYNSKVLNILTPFLKDCEQVDPGDLQEIIEAILVVDPLYDSAVKKKVEGLMKDGKYGSAKKVVENYKKLYHSYYNEPSPTRFLESVDI